MQEAEQRSHFAFGWRFSYTAREVDSKTNTPTPFGNFSSIPQQQVGLASSWEILRVVLRRDARTSANCFHYDKRNFTESSKNTLPRMIRPTCSNNFWVRDEMKKRPILDPAVLPFWMSIVFRTNGRSLNEICRNGRIVKGIEQNWRKSESVFDKIVKNW